MLVPFEKLHANSKIWIYQSNKKLNQSEEKYMTIQTEAFLIEWTAHGQSLQAAMQILLHRFLIIGVNEDANEASGCSIDKSVNHIRELEQSLSIKLLDRSQVAFLYNSEVKLVNFSEIKEQVVNGSISGKTEVFNNAIVTKGELDSIWRLPASESWLKRYF